MNKINNAMSSLSNEQWLVLLCCALFLTAVLLIFSNLKIKKKIKNLFGRYSFFKKLDDMNNLKYEGYVLLKIFQNNKNPDYVIAKSEPIIFYSYSVGNIEKKGMVINTIDAQYNDFNDIPVIECNPQEIVPKNLYSGARIKLNPQLVNKFIVEGAKTIDQKAEEDKKFKMMLIVCGVLVVICIGLAVYFYSKNTDLIAQCSKPVVIQATGEAKILGEKVLNNITNYINSL